MIIWITSMKYFDVIIVGGGPAGSTVALTLSRAGHKVLLFDEALSTKFHIGETLPSGARQLLQKLGILHKFLKEEHIPSYGNLSAWGSQELTNTDFVLNPYGNGWHLNRSAFDMFLQSIAHDAGTIIHNDKVSTIVNEDGLYVFPKSSKYGDIRCKWIIDASGRRSSIARKYGATRIQIDKLVSFFGVFYSNTRKDHDTRTLIESVSNGWWYTVQIPNGKRIVAFLTDFDLVNKSELLSYEGFASMLNETRHVCRTIKENDYILQGSVQGTDAGSSYLDKFVGCNWIAVGDAAMSFDPLSSQGILNAMYTGMKAGNTIHMHLLGKDFLQEYVSNLDKICHVYEQNRIKYYSTEERWLENPFWKRRQQQKKN